MAGDHAGIVALNFLILGIGVMLDVLGILLWNRKIPMNRYIGVRIKSMGDNRDVWLEVNEYAGKVIMSEGILLIVFSLLLMFIPPTSFGFVGRIILFLAVFVISVGLTVWACVNRAKAFANPRHMMSYDNL